MGSIPGQGTKIPHAMLCSLKMKKKNIKKRKKKWALNQDFWLRREIEAVDRLDHHPY